MFVYSPVPLPEWRRGFCQSGDGGFARLATVLCQWLLFSWSSARVTAFHCQNGTILCYSGHCPRPEYIWSSTRVRSSAKVSSAREWLGARVAMVYHQNRYSSVPEWLSFFYTWVSTIICQGATILCKIRNDLLFEWIWSSTRIATVFYQSGWDLSFRVSAVGCQGGFSLQE